MEDRRTILENIDRLEKLIDEEMDKEPDEQDPSLIGIFQTQLGSLIGSKSSYINEHEKLLTKKEKYLKDLKGTREQRKRVADDAKTNFSMWMRELDTIEMREAEGYDLMVQAVAADKATERLSDYHQYEDGEVDRPLLNDQSVGDDDADSE
jgi:hypothetical protein